MSRYLGATLLLLLCWPAQAQELHVPNPYRNLMYEDPLDSVTTTLRLPPWVEVAGAFRLRGTSVWNLDLNRGPTPSSGLTVAGTDPGVGGDYSYGDMRFLLAPSFHLGPEVTVRTALAFFNNMVLGSTPQSYPATANLPMPAGSTSQASPHEGVNAYEGAVELTTLHLEWLSPVGLILAGRTAGDWGLGMVANSGRCPDCDQLQSVDRIAYVTSLFDTLVALSYDFDANGGHAGSFNDPLGTFHDLTDRDDLRTVNLAITHYKLPEVAAMKLAAGRVLFNWGVAFSYRWQDQDLPGYYFAGLDGWTGTASESEFVRRGLDALLADGWFRVATSSFLLEGEAAYLYSTLESGSMMTGVITPEVTSNQWGGVVRARWRSSAGFIELGCEAGAASGDQASGFGASPGQSFDPQPGDIDGSQVDFAGDTRVDNFRFNTNFHVDEILWRRIIGTVTDAAYGKMNVKLRPATWLTADLAAIYSRAMYAESTPGIAKDLGVESIARLTFDIADGLRMHTVGALLVPMDGFRNLNVIPARDPEPAWLLRVLAEARF